MALSLTECFIRLLNEQIKYCSVKKLFWKPTNQNIKYCVLYWLASSCVNDSHIPTLFIPTYGDYKLYVKLKFSVEFILTEVFKDSVSSSKFKPRKVFTVLWIIRMTTLFFV